MSCNEERILQTSRFSVAKLSRPLPGGLVKQREVIRHPGSVVILPLLDQDRVCLIENYRIAVGRTLVELPAGTLNEGESPAACAHRELIEETGYRAGQMVELTAFYAAPGILDEHMHLFVASQLVPGEPAREAEEEIQNRVVPWSEALQMIRTGVIVDAKTIVGLLMYHTWGLATETVRSPKTG